jgi:hypothetical protein
VPPTEFKEAQYSRSLVTPSADIALQDRSGNALRVPAVKLDVTGREALGSQVPSTAEVTLATEEFLRSGTLPGDRGKSLQFLGKRFG